jgi:signal transduction histidine kinase
MVPPNLPKPDAVPLEAVICTDELRRRASRPPDFEAENRAILSLARQLTHTPDAVLQGLVDAALSLCHAHSAGLSLLEEEEPPGALSATGARFRWHAVAGEWRSLVWNTTTPRDDGPCGTVLDRDGTVLFSRIHRHWPQFADVRPRMVEALLVPFHVNGAAVGTVWVVSHDDERRFDAEDQRLLESLATFAATAYQSRLASAALLAANESLREADTRKSEFLAILAHELRNPLAPICNALQILQDVPGDGSARNPALEMMDRHVGQVVRLVDDLLDLSRIGQGKIELRREPAELSVLVNHAVEAVRPLCEGMEHTLTVTLPAQPTMLFVDPTRLAQVLGNLLGNACKFTERGGHIHIAAAREGSCAVIRVRDSGIGIASEQLPRIFDMFTQVDSTLGRSRDGLGIGLTLVKNLVELHDGRIEARSDGVGKGSEFVVTLPVAADAARAPTEPGGLSELQPSCRRRILIVDDSEDAAVSLALLLDRKGHEVHVAHDGIEGVERAAALQPDVILLDIGLPELDGYEVARRIRAAKPHDGPLLIALTGWSKDDVRHRAIEAGFDAHMTKPVDLDALTKLLIESAAR